MSDFKANINAIDVGPSMLFPMRRSSNAINAKYK